MPDFTRLAPPPVRNGVEFTPTFLIAALDAARREAAAPPPPEPEPPPAPDPFEEILAEATRAAREEGRAAGLREAAAEREALAGRAAILALEALQAGRGAAAAAAAEAARELSRMALAVLDAALPGLAAQHGAALAEGFARRLAPLLESAPQARIFVAPEIAGPLAGLLEGLGVTIAEDPALAPGDARAAWQGGGAEFDLAARRGEIRRVLEAAGLGWKE